MAKKTGSGDDGGLWWLLGLLAAGGLIYYSQTGKGKGQDAALLPNSIEDPIDRAVALFNRQFGPDWVNRGFDALRRYMQSAAPGLLYLVDLIAGAELLYKNWPRSGHLKKQYVQRQLPA